MTEPFPKPLSELALEDVHAFLAGVDDEEGVTWEAKADEDKERNRRTGEEPGELRSTTIQKAVSAFANQIGGTLFIGARWDKTGRKWLLPGVTVPEHEADLWLSNVIENVRPVPRYAVKSWRVGENDEFVVAVVRVQPVDAPPCMTAQGHIYERVSGKSERVSDPALLDRLMRRGRARREEAELFARQAAGRAMDLPSWEPSWTVRLGLGLAPVGRETTDISSRLFVESFRAALNGALVDFVPETAIGGDRMLTQDMHALTAHIGGSHVDTSMSFEERQAVRWSTWAYGALWTGAAFASATLSVSALEETNPIDGFVEPGWRSIGLLAKLLGGYGPAHLTFVVRTAPERTDNLINGAAVSPAAQPHPAPSHDRIGRLARGSITTIERTVGVDEQPSADVLASINRELSRAAGIGAYEPES
jgi:hypothetical protein